MQNYLFLFVDEESWLCCESFTAADISLTVLLERLNVLGLENHFWGDRKRPHVEAFYKKVQSRSSYKKTMPNVKIHLRLITQGHKRCTIAASMLTSSLFVVGGFLLVRKLLR